MNQEYLDMKEFLSTLNDDVDIVINKINAIDKSHKEYNFYVRSYIRIYASWVEGTLWAFKEMIKKSEYQWHKKLSIEDNLYIHEHDWKFGNNGQPKLTNKRMGTKENLKGFFLVMAKLFDGFSVDVNKGGWSDVTYFYEIRNGLMHPKGKSSYQVSESELKKCENGRVWLKGVFDDFGNSVKEKIGA